MWSKVECLKRYEHLKLISVHQSNKLRLIVCLVETDCWYADHLSRTPLLRPEDLSIFTPCSDILFEAATATEWWQLVKGDESLQVSLITPYTAFDASLLSNSAALHSYLCLLQVRLRYAQTRSSIISGSLRVPWQLMPWRAYHEITSVPTLTHLLVGISARSYGGLRNADLNLQVLWNTECMFLCVDSSILEHACGRFGMDRAAQAFADLRTWAMTPTARRAVLHAAQVYRLLIHRKVLSQVKPYTLAALFSSALVLCFYHLCECSASPRVSQVTIDLMSEVDWSLVGGSGLGDESQQWTQSLPANTTSKARDFILNGGLITHLGRSYLEGLSLARRTVLYHAHLLESNRGKRGKIYSRVLHALTDSLMEFNVVTPAG